MALFLPHEIRLIQHGLARADWSSMQLFLSSKGHSGE